MSVNTHTFSMCANNSGNNLVRKFDSECMVFLQWLNNFEFVFNIMPYSINGPVELLIAFLEPSVQTTLAQKVAPANVEDLSYDQVVCHLEELYSELRGEDAANKRFLMRYQYPGETVFHYMYALFMIAEKCSPSVRNSTTLINRFTRGLIDENMRRILNDSENIELSDALQIAEQLQSNNNPN